jgi:hypothetical protein
MCYSVNHVNVFVLYLPLDGHLPPGDQQLGAAHSVPRDGQQVHSFLSMNHMELFEVLPIQAINLKAMILHIGT